MTRVKTRRGYRVYQLPKSLTDRLQSMAGNAKAELELRIRSEIRKVAGVRDVRVTDEFVEVRG